MSLSKPSSHPERSQGSHRDRIANTLEGPSHRINKHEIVGTIRGLEPMGVYRALQNISQALTGSRYVAASKIGESPVRKISQLLHHKEALVVLLLGGDSENKLMIDRRENGDIWVYVGPNSPSQMIEDWSRQVGERRIIIPHRI